VLHDAASLGHTLHEFISFIALVGSLYVVAGGIRVQIPGGSTPAANVLFLLTGALAANVLGTTGAAMLLIRPWLNINRSRIAPYHVIFFIFIVANVGGCLTPIGDPPLFLGFLQGVPFWWIAVKCWPMWTVGTGLLLAFSRPILRLLAPGTVAEACAPLFGPVVAGSAMLALTVSGNYALLALGRPRLLALINIVAASAMVLFAQTFLSSRGAWAIVESRMAFAAIAMLAYIPLFRSISLCRFPASSPGMENTLAAEEGA